MIRRFVIPAGANAGDRAYAHRTESWAELAAEYKVDVVNITDQWCVDNQVTGLGIAEELPIPVIPVPVDPTVLDRVSALEASINAAAQLGVESSLEDVRSIGQALGGTS